VRSAIRAAPRSRSSSSASARRPTRRGMSIRSTYCPPARRLRMLPRLPLPSRQHCPRWLPHPIPSRPIRRPRPIPRRRLPLRRLRLRLQLSRRRTRLSSRPRRRRRLLQFSRSRLLPPARCRRKHRRLSPRRWRRRHNRRPHMSAMRPSCPRSPVRLMRSSDPCRPSWSMFTGARRSRSSHRWQPRGPPLHRSCATERCRPRRRRRGTAASRSRSSSRPLRRSHCSSPCARGAGSTKSPLL
jgi:hypothetical protein